jgi:hypothetical protein
LKIVENENIDLLILIGPFVDSDNTFLYSKKFKNSYDEIFEKMIMDKIKDITCKVVLIPSLDDINNDFIFPQMKIDINVDNDDIISLPNPCIFSINEIVSIGISSTKFSNTILQTVLNSNDN